MTDTPALDAPLHDFPGCECRTLTPPRECPGRVFPRCNCSGSHPLKAHGGDPARCPVHGDLEVTS